jgi:predicted helicase
MEKVINEIKLDDTRQFLILSDRKQHLEDMYNIGISNINSIGYYIGGMKKEKLKENESCKILLGTYPMANEGLDIPSLNGLVLSTPKSDIIQSIGRICRIKHNNIQPLIIDIVDRFSIFENQSKKRFAVYKKKKSTVFIKFSPYSLRRNFFPLLLFLKIF